MQELIRFLNSCGIDVSHVNADGKLHRAGSGSKPLWFIVHQNFSPKNGEQFYVAIVGDWRSDEITKWCSIEKLDAANRAAVDKQIKNAQKKADAHRMQEQDKIAQEAKAKWDTLATSGASQYLNKKKINDAELGIRFDGSDIYVPVVDASAKFWSMQKIQENGFKQFYSGGRFKGCFHIIGDIENESTVYVAEGLSTAASIHIATKRSVVVAFNSGNLVNVCQELKKKYTSKSFVVCGDNDLWTTRKINDEDVPWNPGREKAEEAAKYSLGSVVFPTFVDLSSRPTDFNDLFVLEGAEKVANQIIAAKTEKASIIALGFSDGEYFFTSSENPQICCMTSFSDVQFYNLMRKEYWEAAYPSNGNGENKIDWGAAKSHMMRMARKKGLFEPKKVRGSGVWTDDGRTILNMGNHLLVNNEMISLDEINSRYFYTLGKRMPKLADRELNLEECELFDNVCRKFKWQKEESGILLAGALICAKICGSLPIRPHLWITGSAQTGKSTLLERLVYPMLEDHSLYFQGGTTEAGIRQAIKADALPVIFDEFETMGKRSSETIQSVVELMRSAWSETHGYIVKGSATGTANFYQARFSAIVSSIRTNLANDADRSRFAVLELAPHGNDVEHWDQLDALLEKLDKEYVDRLFARSMKMIPIILENYKLLKSVFAQKVSQRFGQQYGMIMAGYSILIKDEALDQREAEILVESLKMEDAKIQAMTADHEDCLNFILTKKVTLQIGDLGQRLDFPLSEAIKKASTNPQFERSLHGYGIAVDFDKFFVHTNNTELRTICRDTRWPNLAETLGRISGAQKNIKKWIGGKTHSCVVLPLTLIS